MNPRLATARFSFRTFTPCIAQFLADWPDQQADYRLHDSVASVAWLAGHIVIARNGAASLLGHPTDLPGWREKLGRGSDSHADDLPSLPEIREQFARVSERLLQAIDAADDAVLDSPTPPNAPPLCDTVGEFIHLLTVHDTYHAGQLALCYKARLGKQLLGR